MDTNDPFAANFPVPTAERPLLGLTVLVVEDSRTHAKRCACYACDQVHGSGGQIASAPRAVTCKCTAPLSWSWT